MVEIGSGSENEEILPYSRPAMSLLDIMAYMHEDANRRKFTGSMPRSSCDVGEIGRATLYEFPPVDGMLASSVVTYTPTGRRILPDDGGKPHTEASVLETTIDVRSPRPVELADPDGLDLDERVTCYIQYGRVGSKQLPASAATARDIKGIDMLRSAIMNGQGEYSG